MFGFKKKEKPVEKEFRSVVTGVAKDLEKVEDEVFSKGFLGDGISITPTDNKFYAPISGTLSSVFPTGHAYGITGEDGIEVLIHIGIDTVQLEGKGFDLQVKQDDIVKQGDLLVICDLDTISSAGYKTDTIVIVTNIDEFPIDKISKDGENVIAKETVILKKK
jgi:PTS system, glucose subfamily, IIA component